MSSITPHYRTVTQLLQSRSFAIDEYQREFKWDKKNIEELLSDLQSKFSLDYVEGHLPKMRVGIPITFLGRLLSLGARTRIF